MWSQCEWVTRRVASEIPSSKKRPRARIPVPAHPDDMLPPAQTCTATGVARNERVAVSRKPLSPERPRIPIRTS